MLETKEESSRFDSEKKMEEMNDLEKIGCRFGHYWVWTSIENRTGMCVRDSQQNCNSFSDQIGFCTECSEGYILSGNGKGNSICEATSSYYIMK